MDKQLAQQLSELKAQMATITSAIERIDQKVTEPESEPQVPLWIKLAGDDSVPLSKVFAATQVWDQSDFDEWSNNWNKTKAHRIQLLREALHTWQADVSNSKPPTVVMCVQSVQDAERLLQHMQAYKAMQNRFIQLVKDHDYSQLDMLLAVDHAHDFHVYYEWVNAFIKHVQHLRPCYEPNVSNDPLSESERLIQQLPEQIALFHDKCVHTLQYLLSEIDTQVITPLRMLDPDTFDEKLMPVEAQNQYKKKQLQIYKADLRRAFEFLNKK